MSSQPRLVWYRGRYAIYTPATGRRRSTGTDDRHRAERLLADYIRGAKRSARTVAECYTAYVEDRKADGVIAIQRIRDAWKALGPEFGHLRPDQVNKDLCQSYARARGRSDGTLHVELGYLRAALRLAQRAGLIQSEPYVWLPSKPPPKDRYLTKAEARKLIDACATPHTRLFVVVALSSAARTSAILELRWDQVDLERRIIELGARDVVSREDRRKRRAVVPINTTAYQALAEAKEAAISDYVIEYGGKPVASIKKALSRATERAGLAGVSAHVLRHTAAVWMAEAGVPMSEIAQYLGHADDRITQRVYAKYSPDYLRKAAQALEI